MNLVKDYMMRTLNSVHWDDTIAHVIEFMHKTEMTVFPVVDDGNTLLGSFCTRNILKNVIPEEFGLMIGNMLLHGEDLAVENMKELKDKKVHTFMSKTSEVVREFDYMDSMSDVMLKSEEQYVFVVNDENKLRGYISQADLLFYLLDCVGKC